MDVVNKISAIYNLSKYPRPLRLKLMCYLIFAYDKLIPYFFVLFLLSALFNWKLWLTGYPCAALGFIGIFHMCMAWLVKCPECNSNIFPFEYDEKKKFKFPPVVKQVMKTNEVTCLNCKTTYKL